MLFTLARRDLGTASRYAIFWTALTLAVGVVAAVWLFTNHVRPQWDMHYYLDMAVRGLGGNNDLAAPFAYRPAAPLIVHAISHIFHTNTEWTFRACNALMCVAFILSCFYFARMLGASINTGFFIAISLALNFNVVKWTLFSGTMVDIYAYPFLLAAFYAILQNKTYWCLAICAIGLFFKEFLLVPVAVQAMVLLLQTRQKSAKVTWTPLALAAAIVILCFLVPRLTIHVARTFQDIDPVNDQSTIRRLLTYPLSRRHDFNIVFAYLAGWLPILALLSLRRLQIVWRSLYPYRLVIALFMVFHFLLVMYGGTNIDIYITYCAPIQIMTLVAILKSGNVRMWELAATLLAVIAFNRIWMRVPLPENGMDAYLDFYGGYYMRVTASSFLRMGELLGYVLAIVLMRKIIRRSEGSQVDPTAAITVPTGVAG